MALDPNLIASIEQSIKDTVSPLLTSPSKGADLYELYIWSLIIEAARAEGATITFYDVNGSLVTSNFVLLGQMAECGVNVLTTVPPSRLPSRGSSHASHPHIPSPVPKL